MYSNCMFCEKPFSANEVLETFPVGRRLAFDSSRGRLWVVCRRCERWNLSPLEERWEAVEMCERLFEATRLRVSTENIGLARHKEGLELVRIGEPMRKEFAAWRYGDQFGRRRKKAILVGVGASAAIGALAIGGLATGVLSGAFFAQSGNFVNIWVNARTLVKVKDTEGRLMSLKNPHLQAARLRMNDGQLSISIKKDKKVSFFEGEEATRVAGLVLPAMNRSGGNRQMVSDAVTQIEQVGHPEEFLHLIAKDAGQGIQGGKKGTLGKISRPTRLALEMALHEEGERRALEGELRGLELIWRQEEEIAGIADNLLLPEGAEERVEALRRDAVESG